jgi:hypothetical protein
MKKILSGGEAIFQGLMGPKLGEIRRNGGDEREG